MKHRNLYAFLVLCTLAATVGGQTQPAQHSYSVLKKWELGGEGGWDYLTCDADARRLYVSRGSHVMVVDIDKGTVVGDVPNTPGVHGVALVPKLKRGFTSNGGDSTVTIFDLETLKETSRVKVGMKPDFILYDPASNCVFTFNAGSSDATAISADNGKVAGTVKLGGRPEAGIADGKGLVYVAIENKAEVVVFDSKKLVVEQRWSIAPDKTPVGIALDAAKKRLFVTCRSEKMVVLDTTDGKIVGAVPIGKGTDACIVDNGLAFSSNKDGTLTVVAAKADGKYYVVGNVMTQEGAKTMALDPTSHRLFLATAKFKNEGGKRVAVPGSFTILVVGQ